MKNPIDFDRLRSALPTFEWPTLGKTVEIPVYVIHNSRDAEDYFFIFDFEEFVERSREGIFVRPKLKVWAGRSDFSRTLFARQFREAFAREFDAARNALKAEQQKGRGFGWLGWDLGFDVVSSLVASFIANIVLLLATTTGRAVLSVLPVPNWVRGKSKEGKLEDQITATQAKVDEALEALEIILHRTLYEHAWREGAGGPLSGMDYEAWPLPDHVVRHLGDGTSGSWW
jgi:hypothetical protein